VVPLPPRLQFVGKDPWRVQTNYFSRNNWRVDPNMSGASGVEQWHDLGFNSQAQFHSYSIRWASWGIQWYVGPKLVRTVYRSNDPKIPDPKFGPLRIAANVWTVDQSAFGWAGRPSDSFTQGTSEYAWIKYQAGDKCEITPDCGF
jgi:beta-glucanase (GH16 family)